MNPIYFNYLDDFECDIDIEYDEYIDFVDSPQTQAAFQHAQKIRVGIIMGGRSQERETSLKSGRMVVHKLSPHTYQIVPLFLDNKLELYLMNQRLLCCASTEEIEHNIHRCRAPKIEWCALGQLVDLALLALPKDKDATDSIQNTLKMLSIPFIDMPNTAQLQTLAPRTVKATI